MNVAATIPCLAAADTAASADGAKQSVAVASPSVTGFLFALLLGDLLQPEAGPHRQAEKKQEDSVPGANVAVFVPVPAAVPMPPGIVLPGTAGQTRKPPFGEEATDLESVPGAAEGVAAVTADLEQITLRDPSPELAPGSYQAPVAPSDLGYEELTAHLAAGIVLETIGTERTVAPSASGEYVPAAPAGVKAPIQQVTESSTDGHAQLKPSARLTSSNVPTGDSASGRLSAPNVAAAGWMASLQAIATFATERASDVPSVSSPEPAAPERGPAVALQAGKANLAFAARLAPVDTRAAAHPGVSVEGKLTAPQAEEPVPCLQDAEMDANLARRQAPAAGPTIAPRRAAHATADPAPAADSPVRGAESPALGNAAKVGDVSGASPPRLQLASSLTEPHRAAVTAPPEPAPILSAPAREIHLQVSGGEQRVDVRLTEHRGEVQVAVRTPDSRLTEALRSDLPALSARLEQNGFRAETWHPAASRPEHASLAPEPSSSGSAPQGHGGERHADPHDHEPPRRAPIPENRSDSPPPEFSWLLSSLG